MGYVIGLCKNVQAARLSNREAQSILTSTRAPKASALLRLTASHRSLRRAANERPRSTVGTSAQGCLKLDAPVDYDDIIDD